jgi:hypothetical protein
MAQLALYLDEEISHKVTGAASKAGLSRSAWVRRVVMKQLDDRLPLSFFEVLGTWEDGQLDLEQILARIRNNTAQAERPLIEP